MLHKSRVDPARSSFQVLYGNHDYNTNPFAPLGMEVELHKMPSKMPAWGTHTKKGYYIGNSWEHYRCHEVWVQETRNVRVGQTVFFKHNCLTEPSVTILDAVVQATDDLCTVLKGRLPVKGAMQSAVELLMDVFKAPTCKAKKQILIPNVRTKVTQQLKRELQSKTSYKVCGPNQMKQSLLTTLYDLLALCKSRTQ